MPTFRFEAMSSSGEEQVGFVEASDRQSAMQSLKEWRLFVTRLVESSDGPAQSDATAANRDWSEQTSPSGMQNSPGTQIPKLVPAFFGVSGFACILGAALLASLTISRISGTVRVEGTVVEIIEVKWLPSLIVGAIGIAFLLVARLASGSRQRWSSEPTAIDAGNDMR